MVAGGDILNRLMARIKRLEDILLPLSRRDRVIDAVDIASVQTITGRKYFNNDVTVIGSDAVAFNPATEPAQKLQIINREDVGGIGYVSFAIVAAAQGAGGYVGTETLYAIIDNSDVTQRLFALGAEIGDESDLTDAGFWFYDSVNGKYRIVLSTGTGGVHLQGYGTSAPFSFYESGTTIGVIAQDGWVDGNETWTYASATTFTIAGDKTGKYSKGDKLKLTQTTVKYFYIVNVSHAAGTTTVTITGGTDYTLANAAITLPFYSKAEDPAGHPLWFNWTPTYSGFTATVPTGGSHKFRIHGTTVHLNVAPSTNGTSNANSFTLTAPVTSKTIANTTWGTSLYGTINNGVVAAAPGRAYIGSNTTTITVERDHAATAWTTSNGKRALFQLFYEF